MGFDTYLSVDGNVVLDWRKYSDALPRLLFRHDQGSAGLFGTDEGENAAQVLFRTTAHEALSTLADAGLGWSATVAAYSEIRQTRGFASGMLLATLWSKGDDKEYDEDHLLTDFAALPPEVDLQALGAVMAHQWEADRAGDLILLSDLSFSGDLPLLHDAARQAGQAAQSAGIDNPFAAARAAESLALLDRTAPLLAWPMVLCVFLRSIEPTAVVELDLSEDANQDLSEVSPQEFLDRYWEESSASLAGEARVMGRLWGVLAGFDSELGREYWFARASELLDRVRVKKELPDPPSNHQKGDNLEKLAEALVKTEAPELVVIEKNLRRTDEELDLVVSNGVNHPFWIALGSPLMLIECKNWSSPIGVADLRVFESKIQDRGALCRVGVFVSMSGFTRPFLERLRQFHSKDGVIFAIDGDEITQLVTQKVRLTDWLSGPGIRRSLSGR